MDKSRRLAATVARSRDNRRPPRAARYASLVLIAIMVLLLGFHGVGDWEEANAQARRQVEALARVLDYQVTNSLRDYDALLEDAAQRVDPRHWPDPLLATWLRGRLSAFPEIRMFTVVDVNGRIVGGNLLAKDEDATAVDVSDRERFLYHRDHPDDRHMHIGNPQISRLDHKPDIPLSRGLFDAGGRFLGIVTIAIDPQYLVGMLESAQIEEAGGASFIRSDGIILARSPNQAAMFGSSVASSPLFRDFVSRSGEGVCQFVSEMDGHAKIVGFRNLKRYPVVATIGVTTWTALASWRAGLCREVVLLAILSTALVMLAILLDGREHARQMLSEEMEAHNRSLQRRVTELKEAQLALAAAKADAERANVAKSRFLAAASHDLRQPMQALNLYLWSLARRLALADRPLVQSMDRCLSGLSELLDDMLDISKLDAGVVTPEVRDFAVADMLERVVAAHAPAADSKGLRLRWVFTRLNGRTDPKLFDRIVGNLVSNAVRYTEAGGVLVGCRRRLGKLWIEVWDSGIGIDPAHTTEIFEEFRQLGNPERSREKGSGLGLAIVRRTADLLGLEIRVASRPHRGSMFAVELPFGGKAEPAVPARIAGANASVRIAIVEDDVAVRESLVYALEVSGHQAIADVTAGSLIERLGDQPPDLMIVDYRLAGMTTGLDAVRSVRAAFGTAMPAVVVTGETDPVTVRAIAARGFRVLHKPLSFELLLGQIAELTGAR